MADECRGASNCPRPSKPTANKKNFGPCLYPKTQYIGTNSKAASNPVEAALFLFLPPRRSARSALPRERGTSIPCASEFRSRTTSGELIERIALPFRSGQESCAPWRSSETIAMTGLKGLCGIPQELCVKSNCFQRIERA